MFRKRGFLLVGLVLMCVCGVAFCGSKDERKPDLFKDTSVLVEAFMVRVSTEGLVKAGVNPISNAPDGISILNILWCLSTDDYAKVVSGAKITASHNQQARLIRHGVKYIKRTNTGPSSPRSSGGSVHTVPSSSDVHFDSFQVSNKFSIVPIIKSVDNVMIQVDYEEKSMDENEDSTAPSTQSTIEWSGVMSVKPGVPAIAAAVQSDEKNVTFLILTATFQGQQETKKK